MLKFLCSMFMLAAIASCAAPANASDSTPVVNVKGKWHGQIETDSAFRISARITGDTIRVRFITDDFSSVFWQGTVPKNTKLSEGQSFVSKADRRFLRGEMLGSHAKTKRFTLVDGKLQFGQSMLDGTKHIETIEKNHA